MHFSLALTVMGTLFGLCDACGAATGPEAQYVDTASGIDWPGFGRTYGEQHFSPLAQIDSRNVGRLGLAWYIDLPPGNAATEPVEVGGVLYYAQGLSIIHAVDAASGKELWRSTRRRANRPVWVCGFHGARTGFAGGTVRSISAPRTAD